MFEWVINIVKFFIYLEYMMLGRSIECVDVYVLMVYMYFIIVFNIV